MKIDFFSTRSGGENADLFSGKHLKYVLLLITFSVRVSPEGVQGYSRFHLLEIIYIALLVFYILITLIMNSIAPKNIPLRFLMI